MNTYFSMFTEAVFGLVILFILTKILGKTQISQLSPFDFVSAVLLGELVGNALFDPDAGIMEIAFVVIVFGTIIYFTEWVTQKFKRTRALLEGSPSIVIYKGKMIRDVMKKNKMDINMLQQLLRDKDVFSLQEVEYAILEPNGKLSVMKKSDYQAPTRKDMKLAPQEVKLPTLLINDGEVIYDNLKEKNLTVEWLQEQLELQGYRSTEEIFAAEYTKGKDLFLVPFINRNHEKWQ